MSMYFLIIRKIKKEKHFYCLPLLTCDSYSLLGGTGEIAQAFLKVVLLQTAFSFSGEILTISLVSSLGAMFPPMSVSFESNKANWNPNQGDPSRPQPDGELCVLKSAQSQCLPGAESVTLDGRESGAPGPDLQVLLLKANY